MRSSVPAHVWGWASQPSIFFILLNLCLLSGLLHFFSTSGDSWIYSTVPWNHEQTAANLSTLNNVTAYTQTRPLGDESSHTSLADSVPSPIPAFCDTCGPEDVYCRKYGMDLLARSRSFEGANARFHRVLRDAVAGKPVKIAILGASVTAGQGVLPHENWPNIFATWWRKQFTGELTIQNGAVRAVGSSYFSVCYAEHIDEDADIVITELAINEPYAEEFARTYELLLRQLLLLPKKPAVLNLRVFELALHSIARAGDIQSAVSQYYDSPVISLRNALLPQMLVNLTASRDEYFSRLRSTAQMDYRHIGYRGHEMAGELLAAFTERQLCTIARRDALDPSLARGSALAAQLPLDMEDLPSHSLFSNVDGPPAPILHSYCASTKTKKFPLIPASNDGRWSNYSWVPPGGNMLFEKRYIVADQPGALISFKVPVREGLGRVRIQYLRSNEYGLGVAMCWLDDNKAAAVYLDGYWTHAMSIAWHGILGMEIPSGEHIIWCELTSKTNPVDKRTHFRLIAVDTI